MLGIIFGTLCLVALVATVRRRHGSFAYRPAWHPGFDDVYGVGHPSRFARRRLGRRNMLRALFARLDTTPGQEKAIVALLDGAWERARASRSELREAQREVGALLGSAVLERAALESALAHPRRLVDDYQQELTTLLIAVHEHLDDKQRRVLGELTADGSLLGEPYCGGCGGR